VSDFLGKRKELVLGLLLVVLAAAVWHTFFGGGAATTGGGSGQAGVVLTDITHYKLYPVDWASLQKPRPSYDPNGRNIFQFGVIPPPPPKPMSPQEQELVRKAQEAAAAERARQQELLKQQQAAAAQQAQAAVAAQAKAAAALPPPPPPKPQPPPIPYRFIGYIGPADNKVAVLHDGSDLLFVRRGEELPKGIKVLEIGYESIKFGFTDPQFKDESRTLPMSSSY
jgi:hypothetical protein